MIVEVTEETFDSEVGEVDGVVVVDFWADWCGPCHALVPILEQLAAEYEGRARFARVNVDENRELAQFFAIRSLPTLGIFRDGETVGAIIGVKPKARIRQVIEEVLEG